MNNKRTTIVSARISLAIQEKLARISDKENISIGSIINRVLSRYAVFENNRLNRNDVLLPKTLIADILSSSTDKTIEQISDKYVDELTSFLKQHHEKMDFSTIDIEYRNFHKYNFLNLNVFEHGDYFVYKCHHRLGKKWSKMFFTISKKIFERIGYFVTDVEINSTFYGFTVRFQKEQ